MELRQYLGILRKWAWLIILGTLLAGGTAFVVSKAMTPIYRASATLLVSEAGNDTITDYTSIMTSERLAKTYGELLEKRPVLEEVISNLGLDLETDDLAEQIEVELVGDTQLIVLSVEDPDPLQAMEIANEIPQVFIAQNEAIQLERFAASKASLLQQMADIEEDIQRTEESIDDLRGREGEEEELARLEDNLTRYRESYSSLLTNYEQIRVTEASRLSNVIVVEPAEIPDEPVSPRTLLNTLLAAVVGAMLAVGVVFLVEYLDDTVKTDEDVQRELALPTLGNIAHIEPVKEPGDHLITSKHPRSPISEAYRVLRSNVRFAWVSNPESALLVTSAEPGEGKTTTAANVAVVMAQAGKRVILVDSDLRRPTLHKFFDLQNNRGLTDLLVNGGLTPDEALRSTAVDGLRVLTSGELPPNPAELLGSDSMRDLVRELEELADVIVLDSPPALAVADASILGSLAGGALMVIRAGKTRSEACRRGKEALENSGVKVLGVVLNSLSRRRGSYGYYYHYQHYYSEPEADTRGEEKPSTADG
jgi:capsular exopolysaccharide synthesis family protein